MNRRSERAEKPGNSTEGPEILAYLRREQRTLFVAEEEAAEVRAMLAAEEVKQGVWSYRDRAGEGGGALRVEVVRVPPEVLRGFRPSVGDQRHFRRACCGHDHPARKIDCFPLSTGRFADVKIAGYTHCRRGDRRCSEEYVKVGDITIYWDEECGIPAQRHPQHRWVCLPDDDNRCVEA